VPAHEVLAAADGCLAPAAEAGLRGAGSAWIVRVPAWSPRPAYLMLEQGGLHLAVPWHAVLRVTLVPAIEIEMRAGTLATPLLAPLVPLAESATERPVVALGFGVKRALLIADRLVWRLAAEPCLPSLPPPVAALSRAVLSDEGEEFWVAEPRVLLQDVALPPLPAAPPAPKPQPAPPAPKPEPAPARDATLAPAHDATRARGAAPAPDLPAAPVAPANVAPGPSTRAEAPPVLSAEDVEPLVLSAFDVEPLAAPPAAESEPPRVADAPAPAAPDVRTPMAQGPSPEWIERMGGAARLPAAPPETRLPGRPVLLAEDSIAAQHFLARMLEQYGFAVHAVASGAELRAALATERWVLACVDVELPDGRGARWLADVREAFEQHDVPCVALVRDDDDADVATEAGMRRWLRKPFDREELAHVLRRLGLVAEASA
jgi:CheY-like chemotaxis protein